MTSDETVMTKDQIFRLHGRTISRDPFTRTAGRILRDHTLKVMVEYVDGGVGGHSLWAYVHRERSVTIRNAPDVETSAVGLMATDALLGAFTRWLELAPVPVGDLSATVSADLFNQRVVEADAPAPGPALTALWQEPWRLIRLQRSGQGRPTGTPDVVLSAGQSGIFAVAVGDRPDLRTLTPLGSRGYLKRLIEVCP